MLLTQPHRGPSTPGPTTIWLMLPIHLQRGPINTGPNAQLHVPPHCGHIYCAQHVSISELPWDPLTAPKSRSQSRTQSTIQACTTQRTQGKRHGNSCLFVWLAGLPGSLDWPGNLSLPRVELCFLSRDSSISDPKSDLHSISIWIRFQEESHQVNPWGRTNHSSWGWWVACYLPLWNTTLCLPGPDFRPCLSYPKSPCLLPIIMVNSLPRPLLKEQWRYQSDPEMDDPVHEPGY